MSKLRLILCEDTRRKGRLTLHRRVSCFSRRALEQRNGLRPYSQDNVALDGRGRTPRRKQFRQGRLEGIRSYVPLLKPHVNHRTTEWG